MRLEIGPTLELQASEGAHDKYGTPGPWAESWPDEQAWKLRRI